MKSACPDRFRRALKHLYRSLWLRLEFNRKHHKSVGKLGGGCWMFLPRLSREVKRHIGDWQKTHPDKLYAIGSRNMARINQAIEELWLAEFVVERDRSVNCNKN